MRSMIEDIIRNNRNDAASLPLRMGLRVMSGFYGCGTALRNELYERKILESRDVHSHVVSVGNLTVGGTGKTPVVIMAAAMFRDKGFMVAVVSRGYGGSAQEASVIADMKGIVMGSDVSGDEPNIIASSLPGVPVVVGRDRVKAAKLAVDSFHPQVIILDDGFQHRRLNRNVDIVTIDAGNPFGNKSLLPRGMLRESPYELKRANAVIVTRCDGSGKERIERLIRSYNRYVPVFYSRHEPVGFRSTRATERKSLDFCKDAKVTVLSNIADPRHYHRMILSLGAKIVTRYVMPDHHRYTVGELRMIESESREAGASMLLMTAKDERNLPANYIFSAVEPAVLDIEAVLMDRQDEFFTLIKPE